MEPKLFSTIEFAEWKAFKGFVDSLSENWAFRGQGHAGWVLNNAIERTDFVHFHQQVEADFLAEFQRGARNYLSRDEIPGHTIEWLALMQHHGAPTRLLDFSRSPFVASFFAFEQCHPETNHGIAIWAINVSFLKHRSLELLAGRYPIEAGEERNGIRESLFEQIFFNNDISVVFPVEPFRMNRRYSLQQSIFVSTGKGYEPFMQQLSFLGEDLEKAFIKMVLPACLQKEVLRDLQRMNLNRASLFPDLDGYAASMKLRYNSMRTPEESMQAHLSLMQDTSFRFIP
ncbi:FRG domain-containing protein [Cnuella takakiae]|uniref:FRG domain-containing protein n=1 Tax=Cnuella takakiae TaxID=1302690 RepID=A0A1M5FR44_9BACT|nr:FRG domain-containing protein [Cnuella takakiae]SHF93978.1 FRG domain-containing protein [Cnuella takakiae]